VLRGAGEHFSAGDDLRSAIEADSAAWAATIEGFQRMTRVVLASPVPAIAAVDGVCVGGALEFAASCDLRLCTDRVRLLTPEIGIGLVMSNAGTLLLPEVLGETRRARAAPERRGARRRVGAGARLRDRDGRARTSSTRGSTTGPRSSRAARATRWPRRRRC
jgi:enoyl-CoA hydratase/carnithine racemase